MKHEGDPSKSNFVTVAYTRGGKIYRVKARSVVMAGGCWTSKHIVRDLPPDRRPQLRLVIVHQHTIEQHREIGGLHQFVAFEVRRFEHDVVGLPFTGLAGSVHQRRPPAVDRSGLTVGIGFVVP